MKVVGGENGGIVNGFKGRVEIGGIQSTGSDLDNYLINYSNIPTRECVKIITGVEKSFHEITVNGEGVKYKYDKKNPELDMKKLVELCNLEKQNNELSFFSE